MLWFRPGTVGSCIGQRANFGNGDVRSFLGRVERYHEGGLALTLRPLACSLPSAVSGRRLAVPPLSCHSRLPPLIKHPANPAESARHAPIAHLCCVRLMCMAVTQRGQGAVKGALSIALQYPSQRVSLDGASSARATIRPRT